MLRGFKLTFPLKFLYKGGIFARILLPRLRILLPGIMSFELKQMLWEN